MNTIKLYAHENVYKNIFNQYFAIIFISRWLINILQNCNIMYVWPGLYMISDYSYMIELICKFDIVENIYTYMYIHI